MDWTAEIEARREGLKRVVAMLFSLALLADLAADLPLARLRFILSILRPAEDHAWRRYIELTDFDAPPPRHAWELPGFMEICDDDGPEDARSLAASLRLIASILAMYLLAAKCAAGGSGGLDDNASSLILPLNITAGLPPVAHRRDWLGPD